LLTQSGVFSFGHIPVPNPSGSFAVLIGCPADQSLRAYRTRQARLRPQSIQNPSRVTCWGFSLSDRNISKAINLSVPEYSGPRRTGTRGLSRADLSSNCSHLTTSRASPDISK